MKWLGRSLQLSMLSLVLVALAACGSPSSSAPPAQRGDLVSATTLATYSAGFSQGIITALSGAGYDTTSLVAQYSATVSRVVYKTVTPDGRLINASGIVAWANKGAGASSPLLSIQHATIFLNDDAPSNSTNTQSLAVVLAATGYIVVMADYIGFGASANETHTYVHARGLAAAGVDMVRAVRRVLPYYNIVTNGQLFLAGYSEGGYATLAMQQDMETHYASEFTITASMPGAGPYDMTSTSQYVLGLTTNQYPAIAGFVFKSYDRWHNWNRLANTSIFQSPYNTVVDTYYDGRHSSGAITTALTQDTASLFDATFRTDFLNAGGELAMKADIAANDIYNWAPARPTRLFHGQDDDVVPYANTTTAHAAMVAAGSTQVTVANCGLPAGLRTHAYCVPDYFGKLFNWFGAMALNL